MRHILNLPAPETLDWLSQNDGEPNVLPVFPNNNALGLVVAHLVSGHIVAEVLTRPQQVKKICGLGIPLGRLYFQIQRNLLYKFCSTLKVEDFDTIESA